MPENEQINVEPREARAPRRYTPPKLEKMQKLAQVTGSLVLTGTA